MSAPEDQIKVLVTGFGPFLDITTNPSWEVARRLPTDLLGTDGEVIRIIVPTEPTPAAYHKILAQTSQLIKQHAPAVIVHMGLDVESSRGLFKVERSAPKEGYHDIPDIDRKVFTRAENKTTFGKAPASLVTSLDIDSAVEAWVAACASLALPKDPGVSKTKPKGKKDGKQPIEVRSSDDVGTYVCGFQYYSSMLQTHHATGRRDIVFLHLPKLESTEELEIGRKVTEELVKILVKVRRP
ncbi:hypothetical protein DE146DRAFT_263705 [Phaeosphaeria sp. MPI-PUGE-AT-0046c]|nr:hypothetical protein DE146DRAFT_263705 [Phaeosphaeria sp. MPI-PUGE-AT-0046c]